MKIKPLLFVVMLVAVFVVGNGTGFFLGIWSTKAGSKFIEDLASDEAPAVTRQPKQLNREAFHLQYAGNWEIDSTDESYDPDHMFSIESPGSAFVMFVIIDVATDEADSVDAQVTSFEKLITVVERTRITKWGQFDGKGVHLSGRFAGMPIGVKIFAHTSASRSLIVVQWCFDEDLGNVQPGFDLVERTFEFTD